MSSVGQFGFFSPVGAGEPNDGVNVGVGGQVFRDKTGALLNFRTLVGTGGIAVNLNVDVLEIDGSATVFGPGAGQSTPNSPAVFVDTDGSALKNPDAAVDFAGQDITNVGTVDGIDVGAVLTPPIASPGTGLDSEVFGAGADVAGAGDNSTAVGPLASAQGVRGSAFGDNSNAAGTNSLAAGEDTDALALSTVALGSGTTVSVREGVGIGRGVTISARGGVGIGLSTIVDGDRGVAIAEGAEALGNGTVALGEQSKGADFADMVLLGPDTVGSHVRACAIGNTAATTAANRTTIGQVGGNPNQIQDLQVSGGFAANGQTPQAAPSVTGSRGGNAALASLLTTLDAIGLIADNTSA